MNIHLRAGDMAPRFNANDLQDQHVDLQQYQGRWLLLSFYRYASCPFCNLRVHVLVAQYEELHSNGLDMLAVFQSPAEKLRKYVGKQHPPFRLLPDPDQTLYRLYGVGHSWKGLLTAAVGRLPEMGRAVVGKGFLPGSVEGGIHRIPADFLIDAEGCIVIAYYGKDIGDHLPLDQLQASMASGRQHV